MHIHPFKRIKCKFKRIKKTHTNKDSCAETAQNIHSYLKHTALRIRSVPLALINEISL